MLLACLANLVTTLFMLSEFKYIYRGFGFDTLVNNIQGWYSPNNLRTTSMWLFAQGVATFALYIYANGRMFSQGDTSIVCKELDL